MTQSHAGLNLRELLDGLSDVSEDLSQAAEFAQFISENRVQLITALRDGSIEEARTIIRTFCFENPLAAGLVNFVMTQNADSAINAIGMYDKPLAESFRGCRENFVRLQTQWANVKDLPANGGGARR